VTKRSPVKIMASTGGSSRQARTATVGFKTEAKLVKLPVTTVSTTGVSQAGDSSVVSSTQATTAGGGLIKSTAVRREVLIRQPSYCKILDDLKGAEARVGHHGVNLKQESGVDSGSLDVADSDESGDALTGQQQVQTITINGQQYQIVSPIGVDGVQTLVTASGGGGGGSPTPGAAALQNSSVVQYAASTQNGQTVFIPGTVATATASGPQIISVASASAPASQTSPVSVSGSDHGGHSGGHTGVGEVTRKRELRLLKNREAARECRNKKKEYIKCLENRVGKDFFFVLFKYVCTYLGR
jgi:hypothetical protein